MADFFDEMDESSNTNSDMVGKPYFMLANADDKEKLKWLNENLNYLKEENHDRHRNVERNLQLAKGIQYRDQETRYENRNTGVDRNKYVDKFVMNHLRDFADTRIARLVKFKPNISVLPTNDEETEDKVAAKMTKKLLDHIWYTERLDGQIIPEFCRNTDITGECYLFIDWDEWKGADFEEFNKALETGLIKNERLLDESGSPIKDASGNELTVPRQMKNGDIDYKVVMTLDVLPQKKERWDNVEYLFRRHVMYKEEAKLRWPNFSNHIKSSQVGYIYNYEKNRTEQNQHQIEVWEFIHKPTRFLPEGLRLFFIKDKIGKEEMLGRNFPGLPCVRLTDVDNAGELHGCSFFDDVRGSTAIYNNLTNLIYRNQVLVSHPKWMYPAGSIEIEDLGNTITTVAYRGPKAPELVQVNPTPGELFNFRNSVMQDAQMLARVSPTARGQPPAGITAAIALQYLSDLDQERENTKVVKYNEVLLQLAQKTIKICALKYGPNDKRLIRVMGKDNTWMSKYFKKEWLDSDYEVRLQMISAVPTAVAARNQKIMDLSKQYPTVIQPELVLDMLDLSQDEKFITEAAKSIRSAMIENDMLLDGSEEVPEPEEYEDHLKHWVVHVSEAREYRFKASYDQAARERLLDHINATEMLMVEKAKTNPIYLEQTKQLSGFPLLFVDDEYTMIVGGINPNQMAEPQMMGPGGELPQEGAPLTQEQIMAPPPVGEPTPIEQPSLSPEQPTMPPEFQTTPTQPIQ